MKPPRCPDPPALDRFNSWIAPVVHIPTGRVIRPSVAAFRDVLLQSCIPAPSHMIMDGDVICAPDHVLLLRPKGGLGDVLTLAAALESFIQQTDYGQYDVVVPADYHFLCGRLVDKYDNVHVYPYGNHSLVGWEQRYVRFYLVWCPAGKHEDDTNYHPKRGRIENFADYLGVAPKPPVLSLTEDMKQRGKDLLWYTIQNYFPSC